MVNRGDIVWLGIASGVMGCLVGGMMLGIGMDLIVNGQPLGWLLLLPGAPVSADPRLAAGAAAGAAALRVCGRLDIRGRRLSDRVCGALSPRE